MMTKDVHNSGHLSQFQQPTNRQSIRLIAIAEVEDGLGSTNSIDRSQPVSKEETTAMWEALDFGRLGEYLEANQNIMPKRLAVEHDQTPAQIEWNRASQGSKVARHSDSIWVVPGSGAKFAVQLIDIEVDCHKEDWVRDVVDFLEDMYYGDAGRHGGILSGVSRTKPSRTHQMVFFPKDEAEILDPDVIQRLIYRADLDADPKFVDHVQPAELNRRPYQGAAVGPFVSVFWGQQDYMENAAFMSALIALSAASVIAVSRADIIAAINAMNASSLEGTSPKDGRPELPSRDERRSMITKNRRLIAVSQNRLALCIDGMSTIAPYVPSLRLEDFHRTMFDALGAADNRESLDRMLQRLESLVRAEERMLNQATQQEAEARTRRWTISVGAASVLAIPISVIFGFFGMSIAEVDGTSSAFDLRYAPFYISVALGTLAIVIMHLLFLARDKKALRRLREGAPPTVTGDVS